MPYALEHVKKQHIPSDEDTTMIQCMICNRWYHSTCAGISGERMKLLSNPKAVWMCEDRGCAEAYGDLFSDSD